jgi:hypothetical protein
MNMSTFDFEILFSIRHGRLISILFSFATKIYIFVSLISTIYKYEETDMLILF